MCGFRITTRADDVRKIVPLIKGDRRFRPAEEGGDGRLSDACLYVAHFVLALGVDGIGSSEDHDAFLGIGKAIPILARRAPFLGCCLLALSFLWPIGLS